MEEIYKAIEDKIKAAGYDGRISGQDIYDEICDGIDGKENGSYIFMSKKEGDVFFEYNVQVFDENFNLSTLTINTGDNKKIVINFDEE